MPAWTLRIEMQTDWHVGSGFGIAGGIDRLATVDRDGLPLIPGKTVTGMLRDAAEQLASGMDAGDLTGRWHVWLQWLFGDQPSRHERGGQGESLMRSGRSPQPARLQVRTAELPAALRDALRGQDDAARQLRQSLFCIKPGVKIDPANGQAEAKHLRFVQMVRGGLTLQASLLVDAELSPHQLAFVEQFLAGAAILVTHLGGKRRRGAGRCRWSLHAADNAEPLDVAEQLRRLRTRVVEGARVPEPPSPEPPSPAATGDDFAIDKSSKRLSTDPSDRHRLESVRALQDEPWLDIPLEIETVDPVCVAEAVIGNVTQTMDLIPGTYLLPHLTRRLAPLGVSVPAAISGDAIRVLPATIELNGQRSIAVPLAWEMKKEGGSWQNASTLVNRMLQTPAMVTKQLREGYIACGQHDAGEVAAFAKPCVDFFTHNTIDEEAQRPTESVGGVYSYQALLPNRFQSLLRLRESLVHQLMQTPGWEQKLGGGLRLGRSSKDSYGRARLHVGQPVPAATAPWRSGPAPDPDPAPGGASTVLTVMLLSDTLVEDVRGRFAVTAASLVEELSTRLGVSLRLEETRSDTAGAAAGNPAAFLRVRRIESWQSSWNLPRPSLVALRAGCCLRLRVDSPPADYGDRLRYVELAGIGVRRAEGFGQVAFNHPLLDDTIRTNVPAQAAATVAPRTLLGPHAAADLKAQAEAIERTCWQRLIEQIALDKADLFVSELGWRPQKPESTQAAALRARAALIASWQDRLALRRWLDHLVDNPLRAKKWPARTFATLSLWLDLNTTENPSNNAGDAYIWRLLDAERWPRLTQSDHLARFRADGANWALAVGALLDACTHLQQRRNRRRVAAARSNQPLHAEEVH